jgi:hypothetical protein
MGNEQSVDFSKQMQFKETPSEQECRAALLSLKYLETFFGKYDDDSFSEKLSEARPIIENMEKIIRDKKTLDKFEAVEKKRRELEKEFEEKKKEYVLFMSKEYSSEMEEVENKVEETTKYQDLPELEDGDD